jgi:hypothetical protein
MEQVQAGSTGTTKPFTKYDADYKALVKHMQRTLDQRLSEGRTSLFRTKTEMKPTPQMVENKISVDVTLNHVYLGALTEDERAYHTCSCCGSFMKHYAGTVMIDKDGKTKSVLWDSTTFPTDNYYFTLVERMQEVVESGRVVGPFKDNKQIWGAYEKGGFEHFGIMVPSMLQHTGRLTPRQRQAQLREDYKLMAQFFETEKGSVATLKKLMQIIEAEVLAGDELIEGSGRWLYETAVERAAEKNSRARENKLWRAVSAAAAGWAHPNKTMVGTVLDDLLEGKSFEVIKRKFGKKTQADVFRRPVAPPTMNQLQIAEKRVAELGMQQSLRRRVAYLEDIPTDAFHWDARTVVNFTPTAEERPAGVFAHLAPKTKDVIDTQQEDLKLPPVTMSWNKFRAEVLPKALDIEIYIPWAADFFTGTATAADPEAPPILMYDFDDYRNPMSMYQRSSKDFRDNLVGTTPDIWNLANNHYHKVQGIVKAPHMFGTAVFPQLGEQALFIIEGAYDKQNERGDKGIALFPQLLKQDLYDISRVVETYSNEAVFEGDVKRQVCGLMIVKNGNAQQHRRLKVKTEFGDRTIIIDRWE